MRGKIYVALIVFAVVLTWSSAAFAWGYTVHAWAADSYGKRDGDKNLNEVYGALLPDTFNHYLFSLPCFGDIYFLTHFSGFMSVDYAQKTGMEKGTAYGFLGHNNDWGLDSTSHTSGMTTCQGNGYVICKAAEMAEVLPADVNLPLVGTIELYPLTWLDLDGDEIPDIPAWMAAELYHGIVEYAIDLKMKEVDQDIGLLLLEAAEQRSDKVPGLMVEAFVSEPAFSCIDTASRATFIETSEATGRQIIYDFGGILAQPYPFDLFGMAELMAAMGAGFLGLPEPPPGLDILVAGYLMKAQELVDASFLAEIDESAAFVDKQMKALGYK
jgi:hypothetical protein